MTRRVVIADAGPLIALARIKALDLLRQLFTRVFITTMVRDEILPAGAAFAEVGLLTSTPAEGWIEVVDVPTSNFTPINPGVDAGEASSIHFAKQRQNAGDAVLMVIDDRAGRLEAKSHGLGFIGSAALIGLAKAEGLVPAARPLLEQIVASGYFVAPAIVSAILEKVEE